MVLKGESASRAHYLPIVDSAAGVTARFLLQSSELKKNYTLRYLVKVHRWDHIIHNVLHPFSYFVSGVSWSVPVSACTHPLPPLYSHSVSLCADERSPAFLRWTWSSFLPFLLNTVPHERLGRCVPYALSQVRTEGLFRLSSNRGRSPLTVPLGWAVAPPGCGLFLEKIPEHEATERPRCVGGPG